MVCRQTVCNPGAPVMGKYLKLAKTVVTHHSHGIERHGALGIGVVLRISGRANRIAVAAQIHQHHGEFLCQRIGHGMPHHMRLRMPMHQQQRGTGPTPQRVQDSGRAFDITGNKRLKHGSASIFSVFYCGSYTPQLGQILSQSKR